jgi:prephenate dehydrogenase
MFGTVAIVGPGLIGGSIGLGLKNKKLATRVVGIVRRESSINEAKEKGAIDDGTLDIAEGVRDADVVILATPVNLIVEHAREAMPHMKESAILTDVGSAKSHIVTETRKILRNDVFFVGGHPIAGSEKRGVASAVEDLFEKSTCVLTPNGSNLNDPAIEKIAGMWKSLGATVKFLSPEEHDKTLAYTSHLPHLVASSLANTIMKNRWPYGGDGLKDTTRPASSDADLWVGICKQNRDNIVNAIEAFLNKISAFKEALSDKDDEKIRKMLEDGKKVRDARFGNNDD